MLRAVAGDVVDGVFHVGVCRIVPSVGDVVAHRAVEEEDVLLNDRQQISIGAQSKVANVTAVEHDASARRIVEARYQVGDRGLPRPAAANERNH